MWTGEDDDLDVEDECQQFLPLPHFADFPPPPPSAGKLFF